MSFALDHVVIGSPDPEALAGRIAGASGLPVLRGWTPAAEVRSWGVRFANGPFIDVNGDGLANLGLRGPIPELERLAARRGWRIKVLALDRPPAPYVAPPWSIAAFRKRQGALSAVFVIDYRAGDPAWAEPEFSGELFRAAPAGEARLERVILAAPEGETVDGLAELLPPEVEVRIGPAAKVVALEVAVPRLSRPASLQLTPTLSLALRRAP